MTEGASTRTRGAALQQALLALEDYLARIEPGTLLPSERELARRFSVSRTTLRSAVAELALKGRLDVRHGTGTIAGARAAPVEEHRSSVAESGAAVGVVSGSAGDLAELVELLAPQLARLAARRALSDRSDLANDEVGSTGTGFLQAVAAASGNASSAPLLASLLAALGQEGDGPAPRTSGERLLAELERATKAAIEAGDADAAAGAMSLYLATWRRQNRLY